MVPQNSTCPYDLWAHCYLVVTGGACYSLPNICSLKSRPKCPCHDLKLKGTKAVPQELEAEMALLWPAITKLAQRYRDATEERDQRQRLTQARTRWRSLCEFHCDLEFHLSYDKRTYNLELIELMGEQKGL
jgi:hypothetical protein